MLLKKSSSNSVFFRNTSTFFGKKKVLIGTILFTLYTVLILGLGYVLQRHDFYGLFLKPVLIKNYRMVESYFESFSTTPEKIIVNIKHKDYLKLAYKRQGALNKRRLYYSPEDWVPATLIHRGKTHKVDIRLKGTGDEHWKHEYLWSFKIKVKGSDTLFGMKRFSYTFGVTCSSK